MSEDVNDIDYKFDAAVVCGYKSADNVLVIGNSAFVEWLTKKSNVKSVKKSKDIEKLIKSGIKFDKVILGKDIQFSDENIIRAGLLLRHDEGGTGLLVYFPGNDGDEWQFRRSFEFYYPTSNMWTFDTTNGRVIISEPFNTSWRMIVS
jgi:hypothetical protein